MIPSCRVRRSRAGLAPPRRAGGEPGPGGNCRGVRWGAAASTASFTVMAMVEPLHGLTFALAHLTCVTVIGRIMPPALAATAQAFYATVALGITGAVATLASGPL
ncbi:MAG: MFS transporter [Janthinobacterium lividum]